MAGLKLGWRVTRGEAAAASIADVTGGGAPAMGGGLNVTGDGTAEVATGGGAVGSGDGPEEATRGAGTNEAGEACQDEGGGGKLPD